MTRYDKFKSMDIDELASKLYDFTQDEFSVEFCRGMGVTECARYFNEDMPIPPELCKRCIKRYLLTEVENSDV